MKGGTVIVPPFIFIICCLTCFMAKKLDKPFVGLYLCIVVTKKLVLQTDERTRPTFINQFKIKKLWL